LLSGVLLRVFARGVEMDISRFSPFFGSAPVPSIGEGIGIQRVDQAITGLMGGEFYTRVQVYFEDPHILILKNELLLLRRLSEERKVGPEGKADENDDSG
jgi:hypothetical protein